MKAVNRILIPTDFSEFSLTGLEYVTSLLVFGEPQIYLLNVVDHDPVLSFHTVDLHSETILRDRESQAAEYLNELIAQHLGRVRAITPVVRRGDPAREIVRFAVEEGVDLVLMATHGRTGLAHVFLGSVAEKVVRRSPVPVLTVKPPAVSECLLKDEDIEEQLHLRLWAGFTTEPAGGGSPT